MCLSGLVEENFLEMFLFFWCKISSPFRKNNNVVVLPFPFHFSCHWPTLVHQFPILRTISYPLIRPPKRPLALDRRKIFIPGFIRSPPTLAVCSIAHSLPPEGVGRDYPFTEDEIRKHFSYLSIVFRDLLLILRLFIYWGHLYVNNRCPFPKYLEIAPYAFLDIHLSWWKLFRTLSNRPLWQCSHNVDCITNLL